MLGLSTFSVPQAWLLLNRRLAVSVEVQSADFFIDENIGYVEKMMAEKQAGLRAQLYFE